MTDSMSAMDFKETSVAGEGQSIDQRSSSVMAFMGGMKNGFITTLLICCTIVLFLGFNGQLIRKSPVVFDNPQFFTKPIISKGEKNVKTNGTTKQGKSSNFSPT